MRFGFGFIVLRVYIHGWLRFVDWSCVTKASIFRLEFSKYFAGRYHTLPNTRRWRPGWQELVYRRSLIVSNEVNIVVPAITLR